MKVTIKSRIHLHKTGMSSYIAMGIFFALIDKVIKLLVFNHCILMRVLASNHCTLMLVLVSNHCILIRFFLLQKEMIGVRDVEWKVLTHVLAAVKKQLKSS